MSEAAVDSKHFVRNDLIAAAITLTTILPGVAWLRDYFVPGSDTVNEFTSWLSKLAPAELTTVTEIAPVTPPELVPKPEVQAVPASETASEPVHKPEATPEHKPPEPRAVVRDYDLARLNLNQIAHPSEMTSRLPTTEEVASLTYNMRNMYGIELTESQIETVFREGYVEIRGERFQLWENNKTPEFYLTPTPSVR